MKGEQTFQKGSRVRTSGEYEHIWRCGKRYHTAHFIVIVCPSNHPVSRMGLTVSRKVGNAVYRNRLKRWIRELFRKQLKFSTRALDISIIAKRHAGQLAHDRVDQELSPYLARLETGNDG